MTELSDAAPPPPQTAPSTPATPLVTQHPFPPAAGELTVGWRTATAAVWVGVIVALAGVWNASVQLGLSTWWLGPRADPQPLAIRLLPFAAPVLMLLGAINRVKWLAFGGVAAAVATAGVGLGDLSRVGSLAAIELAIAGAAGAASLASLTGTYRSAPSESMGNTTDAN